MEGMRLQSDFPEKITELRGSIRVQFQSMSSFGFFDFSQHWNQAFRQRRRVRLSTLGINERDRFLFKVDVSELDFCLTQTTPDFQRDSECNVPPIFFLLGKLAVNLGYLLIREFFFFLWSNSGYAHPQTRIAGSLPGSDRM